jgi:spoIIIJ-associated protein
VSSNVDDTMESLNTSDTAGDAPVHDARDSEPPPRIASEVIASTPAPPVSGGSDPAEDEDATVSEDDFEEDGRADSALDFVVEVLTTMGMDCTVDLMENSPEDPPSDIRIEISGRDATRLIGKKGQTLAALQFLTNRVINRPTLPRRHILIDADGYRTRRENALSTMAQKLGAQAVAEGKIITFEPMSAQDRRVVHLALAKFPGVVTKSEGKGASRRVQIIPVRDE